MLKFLLIFFIISYLVYKVGGYLLRGLYMTMGQPQGPRQKQKKTRKAPDSDLNIDYVPNDGKDAHYDGGEYVDFEEVK